MADAPHHSPRTAPGATDDERREDARRHVRQLRAFQAHAAVFAGSMAVMLVVNLLVNLAAGIAGEWWAWWSVLALLGWAVGVAIHGVAVWASRARLLGSAWEERKIDELLASR